MSFLLRINTVKMYIAILFAFLFIEIISCEVTGKGSKASGSKSSSKSGQELKLPNLKDCKDRKYHNTFINIRVQKC